MAIISICPRCQASLQVAERWTDPNQTFACPKCSEEFPLHEALDIMAESPPEAKPVEASGASAPVEPPAESAPSETSPADAIAAMAAASPAAASPNFQEFSSTVSTDSRGQQPRRKRRGPSATGTIVGVIGGGVMGIYLGAFVLSKMGVPLPDVVMNLPGIAPEEELSEDIKPKSPDESETPVASVDPVTPPPKVEPVPKKNTQTPAVTPPRQKNPPKDVKPEPKVPPEDFVGVLGAPTFTPNELGAALGAAHKASGGGPGNSGLVGLLDESVYEKLCTLATRTTFVTAVEGDKTLEDRKAGIDRVIKRVVGSYSNVVQLGKLGTARLAAVSGDDRGIVVAGRVFSIHEQEKVVVIELVQYGSATSVTVLSPIRANLSNGNSAVILGTVVDDPGTHISGYSGNLKRVIWGGRAVRIPSDSLR